MNVNRANRWWVAGAAVLALLLTATTIVMAATRHHDASSTPSKSPAAVGLPAQLLLTSSMRKQPVPGWQISAEQLGLPPGGVPKLIGNVGDRGIFLGITGTGWWLAGVDVATGKRLFPAVELGRPDDALGFNCFVNGPKMVLCIREDRDPAKPARAWVVDTDHGSTIFDGPTELRIPPFDNHPTVEQRGDYAVATVSGEGVHGVGPHAELTWFVPGGGHLSGEKDWEHDAAPQSLAAQDGGPSSSTYVVFSLADGTAVKPQVPQGVLLSQAIIYPGGFGYEYSVNGEFSSTQVRFFDDTGKALGQPDFKGTILTGSRDVPMVTTPSKDVVLTLDGHELLELAATPGLEARLVGQRLFVTGGGDDRHWRQYDLQSGATEKTCDIEGIGSYYIASDGEVAVLMGDDSAAVGYDLATCDKLWSIPSSVQDVWRVNTTLIEHINDEMFSLVAPP
ncbi:MAG: hypothetical protein QOK33_4513 [Mycobacterium sp.]|jgi:hypothetical protein|nr:hypothetical protein [Mycobacterium sp.]MDT5401282.1 hypothetical protein [Mycobacterium sp.]